MPVKKQVQSNSDLKAVENKTEVSVIAGKEHAQHSWYIRKPQWITSKQNK